MLVTRHLVFENQGHRHKQFLGTTNNLYLQLEDVQES